MKTKFGRTCMGLLTSCLCAVTAFGLFSVDAHAVTYKLPEEYTISSRAAYLYNLDSETEVMSLNAQEKMPPASTAKIMTCLLALENTANLDTEIVHYPQAVFTEMNEFMAATGLTSSDISQADVQVGEELTMRQALYCLMLQSDCYSAQAIARHIGEGDSAAFVEMMNTRAEELGAANTYFTNPHGLYEPEMVTTAYDLFLITKYAMQQPAFMDICSTPTIDIAPTNVARHADQYRLISTIKTMIRGSDYYYEPIAGIKTGTLPEVGMNYVSTASKDGYNYLLVLMGAPAYDEEGNSLPEKAPFIDAKTIYDWAFECFEIKTLYEKGATVGQVNVNLSGEEDYVNVLAADSFMALVPVDATETGDGSSAIAKRLNLPESVDAPIRFGEKLGTMDVVVYGEAVGSIDLIAKKDVNRSQSKYMLSRVTDVLSKFWIKFVVVLVTLIVAFYVVLMILRNRYRRRYRRARGRRR